MSQRRVEYVEIIGTRIGYYTAWEPDYGYGQHSILTTLDGARYGRIDSRHPPADINTELAVRQWYESCRQEAYGLIAKHYPEAAFGYRLEGMIWQDRK